jgi:CheY-like chemotaxis protein
MNAEEFRRPTLVPPIVRIVLTQATRQRSGGRISQTIFDEQIRRIDREELAPKGLSILVRDLPDGRTRFLIKNKLSGTVCEMFDFAQDGTHELSDGMLRASKRAAAALEEGSSQKAGKRGFLTPYARVLVVDDHVETADGFGRLLKRRGYQTAIVYDGPSAVDAAAEVQPNIAVIDIDLPGMDGCEVAMTLRKNPAHWNCLLIAVTGFGEKTLRERCAEAGFDHYLTKPVDIDRLHVLMTESLSTHA